MCILLSLLLLLLHAVQETVGFDALFMVQHYVLYPAPAHLPLRKVPEDAPSDIDPLLPASDAGGGAERGGQASRHMH